MSQYRATARREGRLWVVDVDGVGVTQGRNLEEARAMALDLIHAIRQEDPTQVDLEWAVDVGDELTLEVQHARDAVAAAEAAQREAAVLSRQVARVLADQACLSGRDVAVVLGVSPQRVSQLLAAARTP